LPCPRTIASTIQAGKYRMRGCPLLHRMRETVGGGC
jgi:hypothetical protein